MLWVGFDVGGTFTDLVAIDLEARRMFTTKTPSSSTDPAAAALLGVTDLLKLAGRGPNGVSRIVHGTTIATNALIEGGGAKVGFLCNQGFRDVVEIGRMFREDLYDINFVKTPPLVPRDLRRGIPVRNGPDGSTIVPLDVEAASAAIGELADAGVEAFAVGLLHSYVDPRPELQLRELITEQVPGSLVTLSHEVSMEYGEHERWTSAIVNAYLMPLMRSYLQELELRLGEIGIEARLEVMQSNGGVVPIEIAADFPVRLLESGPAGGVSGMGRIGSLINMDRLITFDMGGTSTDVSVVVGGKPAYRTEAKIEGHPVRAMMVDIHSIGAGGGSLARLDASNTLYVGPESAGSRPGPAAAGLGGTRPTITDADIVLGYLNTDRYCAGSLELDLGAAHRAIEQVVAKPTGNTVEQAALGMVSLAVRNMSGATRTITTVRGLDPREFALVASGGAGPVHAGLVARELHIPTVIIPAYPALLSAQGMLFADYRSDVSQTFSALLEDVDATTINTIFSNLVATGRGLLGASAEGTYSTDLMIEMCYEGQQYGVTVPVPASGVSTEEKDRLGASLDKLFVELYGFIPEHNVPKLVNLRAIVQKQTPEGKALHSFTVREESKTATPAMSTRRMVFSEYPGGTEASVFDRAQLATGVVVEGPSVIEEDYSTTVVFPGQRAQVDHHGNIMVATGAGRS